MHKNLCDAIIPIPTTKMIAILKGQNLGKNLLAIDNPILLKPAAVAYCEACICTVANELSLTIVQNAQLYVVWYIAL